MDPLTQHHFYNIANGKALRNDDGTLSTVRGIVVNIDGREMLIPTIWDGKEVSTEVAIENAKKSGVNWEKGFGDSAVQQLEQREQEIKTFKDEDGRLLMSDEWTPEEAQEKLDEYEDFKNPDETMSLRDLAKTGVAFGLSTAKRAGLIESPFPYLNYLKENFSTGGFITKDDGMKGRSEEDKEIADNKEQVDIAEADRDEDGFVSPAEREVQLALQNNELVDEDEMNLYHGGMPCGADGNEEVAYDEVSGNPIPLGSTAENVRDDIDANLSSGEYVLPAHVVKYHGLKHIMEMQAEAEMGLMSMHMDGLIQHVEEEVTECPMCEGKGCDHCENTGYHSGKSDSEGTEEAEVQASDDTEQEEAEAEAEASEEIPSEKMDVEIATVKVDDHLNDDEDMEISPVSKPLPAFVKKQKYAFAV
tara:strand:+ start:332 stop:1585 length:1254 start_codon:yes stop_codon:yes gene_type:complete